MLNVFGFAFDIAVIHSATYLIKHRCCTVQSPKQVASSPLTRVVDALSSRYPQCRVTVSLATWGASTDSREEHFDSFTANTDGVLVFPEAILYSP